MKLTIEPPESGITEPGEVHLHVRFRPASMVGLVLMLLVHGILLYLVMTNQILKKKPKPEGETTIVFISDKSAKAKGEKVEKKKIEPPKIAQSKRAITQPKAAPVVVPDTPSPIQTPNANAPEVDMSAMLNAARERRRATEEAAAQENVTAGQSGRELTPQEKAEANVKRSLQQANGGSGGVFQILSKSTRTASFSFNGWKGNASVSTRQVIPVDAGLGGDIELAIIRRMIVLIRTQYKGDFTWESHRLGRLINLSARVEDNAELENFMMKEFFSNSR